MTRKHFDYKPKGRGGSPQLYFQRVRRLSVNHVTFCTWEPSAKSEVRSVRFLLPLGFNSPAGPRGNQTRSPAALRLRFQGLAS
jgi:hypothetical protein